MRSDHCVAMGLLLMIAAMAHAAAKPAILRAEVKSQRYCEVGSSKEMALMVRFKSSVTNAGAVAVVVTDQEYPLILVSNTLSDLRVGKHEFELHAPDVFPLPISRDSSQKAAQPQRHIVRPGETFEFDTMEVTIPIAKTVRVSKQSALHSGTHYIELVMELNAEGTATFVRAVSQPLKLAVEKYPKTEECR